MTNDEPKDLSAYFKNSNIEFEITSWKQVGRDYWLIFLPIDLDDQPQSCLQKINNEVSRLDFVLREVNGKLAFNDLTTNQGWYFDTSEIHLSKFHLVGEHSKGTFVKEPVVNLGIGLQNS